MLFSFSFLRRRGNVGCSQLFLAIAHDTEVFAANAFRCTSIVSLCASLALDALFHDAVRSHRLIDFDMEMVGVVIAGGKGLRLGGDKPLHAFGGATLLETVIERMKPQVEDLAVNVPSVALSQYRARLGSGFELLSDHEPGDIGPLAGILAGLDWAERRGASWLATFPSDTPFLPRNLVARLLASSRSSGPVAAHDGDQLHGLCAVWPVRLRQALQDAVRNEKLRSLHRAIARLGGAECAFEGGAVDFMNVNTPEDLREAERILANSPPR
jgi:molybdopterin-guanine dinucleotide biosynthesis protein A